MSYIKAKLLLAFTCFLWFEANPAFSEVDCKSQKQTPVTQLHFMVIMLENQLPDKVYALPFFGKLASEGVRMDYFFAEMYPSQPNYFALTAGNTYVDNNDAVTLDVNHIGNLIEEKGLTWKAYLGDYPGNCYQGLRQDGYLRAWNPFISFKDVVTQPSRCSLIVNSTQFATDLGNDALPNFIYYALMNTTTDIHPHWSIWTAS